jgi:hypothetical protein
VTVNVPNTNGSFTPVTLIKQKDGYIGPQGEYYPGNPTVDQLKVLYGKQKKGDGSIFSVSIESFKK